MACLGELSDDVVVEATVIAARDGLEVRPDMKDGARGANGLERPSPLSRDYVCGPRGEGLRLKPDHLLLWLTPCPRRRGQQVRVRGRGPRVHSNLPRRLGSSTPRPPDTLS